LIAGASWRAATAGQRRRVVPAAIGPLLLDRRA